MIRAAQVRMRVVMCRKTETTAKPESIAGMSEVTEDMISAT